MSNDVSTFFYHKPVKVGTQKQTEDNVEFSSSEEKKLK